MCLQNASLPSWRKLARILMLPGDTSMRCRSIVCAWPVTLPLYLADATLALVERYPSRERVKVSRVSVWMQFLRALLPGKIS